MSKTVFTVYRGNCISGAVRAFSSALLLFMISCTSLTEYESTYSGELHILSPADFSTIGTVRKIPSARSLLIYPDGLLVATTGGTVLSYALYTYELIGEYTVGSPSAAGYMQMAYSSLEDTAYLIGSMGKLLEISLPECTVLDEFTICQSPVKIVVARESPYIYIVDGPSNRFYQVAIENNIAYTSVSNYYTINCVEPGQNPDSILLGTSAGINLIEVLSPGTLRNSVVSEPVPCLALAAVPGDTVFVGVKGYAGTVSVGVVDEYNAQFQNPPLPEYYGEVDVTGNSHYLAIAQDSTHAFVLSSIGNSTSRLLAYNYTTYSIDQQVDIPGFPLDLKISDDGTIFALTCE